MTETPILTVTLNPALDLSTTAPEVVAGPKLRCTEPLVDPGGGGINVARAIHILGGEAKAVVARGGANGGRLCQLLADEGVETLPLPAPGETRVSLAVTERTTGAQYRFVLPGPDWTATDQQAAVDAVRAAAGSIGTGAFVVLSGSQPPGVAPDFPLRIAEALGPDVRLIVDTSGAALARVAEGGGPVPEVLRMDGEEAEELAGHPLPTAVACADFAAGLVARGAAKTVVVARGGDGGVLATAGLRLSGNSARVQVVSKVGAGDSFVGAFTLALARGAGWEEALRRGNAAASAAVMTEATALCRREDAERLYAECLAGPV